ncbi:MAG: tetratricopeptide repeat protein, partial [Planctomycetes bacterium]|nr:tetratricopeptide repeat protein [Planctomycetota bacterium]
MFGYHGSYLRVELETGRASRVALDERTLRDYLGGSGLGVAILLTEGAAEAEPLAAEAALAFVFSPLVGSPLTTSAKFAVVSKSPLSGRAHFNIGSALAVRGRTSEAIIHFREAVRINANFKGHTILGTALMEAGRPQEATTHFQKALGIEPNYRPAHL